MEEETGFHGGMRTCFLRASGMDEEQHGEPGAYWFKQRNRFAYVETCTGLRTS